MQEQYYFNYYLANTSVWGFHWNMIQTQKRNKEEGDKRSQLKFHGLYLDEESKLSIRKIRFTENIYNFLQKML